MKNTKLLILLSLISTNDITATTPVKKVTKNPNGYHQIFIMGDTKSNLDSVLLPSTNDITAITPVKKVTKNPNGYHQVILIQNKKSNNWIVFSYLLLVFFYLLLLGDLGYYYVKKTNYPGAAKIKLIIEDIEMFFKNQYYKCLEKQEDQPQTSSESLRKLKKIIKQNSKTPQTNEKLHLKDNPDADVIKKIKEEKFPEELQTAINNNTLEEIEIVEVSSDISSWIELLEQPHICVKAAVNNNTLEETETVELSTDISSWIELLEQPHICVKAKLIFVQTRQLLLLMLLSLINKQEFNKKIFCDHLKTFLLLGKYLEKIEHQEKERRILKDLMNLIPICTGLIKEETIIDNIVQEIDKISLGTDTLDKEQKNKLKKLN